LLRNSVGETPTDATETGVLPKYYLFDRGGGRFRLKG
jgi:hypothetical protein